MKWYPGTRNPVSLTEEWSYVVSPGGVSRRSLLPNVDPKHDS